MLRRVLRWAIRFQWMAPFLTRVTVGWIFVESGWGKLQHLDKVVQFFTELGIPLPAFQAPFVAGVELVCGSLLLVGIASRLMAFPLIGTMGVAILTAKREDLSSLSDLFGMSEFLYILLLVWIILYGPGRVAMDPAILARFRRRGR